MAAANGFEFWKKVLNGARYVVAPMVDQSELPWRMLSRQLGSQLCYTPMLHASLFSRDARYRRENFTTCPEDRPLIVQFCANDPDVFVKSSQMVEGSCDAVDLNLGCPQAIARRGHYGAFLQDEWDLIRTMVKKASEVVAVPITCKIRVFEDVERTVEYARMLESAGCKLLTVHGRTRDQKAGSTGLASWKHIAAVRRAVGIPVFANGNVQSLQNVLDCLEQTGVEGIMSAEGNLHNPAIFTGRHPFCWEMAERYLDLVDQYPAPLSAVRGHLFKIWHHALQRPENHQRREEVGCTKSLDQLKAASRQLTRDLKALLSEEELQKDFSPDCIPYWRCQPYFRKRPKEAGNPNKRGVSEDLSSAELGEELVGVEPKKLKKKKKAKKKDKEALQREMCSVCKVNPKGLKCVNGCCKLCCRPHCRDSGTDCEGHHFVFSRKMVDPPSANDGVLLSS